MINMPEEERLRLGKLGREHVQKNYNFNSYTNEWVKIIDETIEKHGSWDKRKLYKPYTFTEIK